MTQADTLPAPLDASSRKRRSIAAAAEALFLEHGYGAVSMDTVARTAGVSKATLYAHFASKDALFAGMVADKGPENPFPATLLPEDAPDLRATLLDVGGRMLRFMLRPRTLAIFRIAVAECARFPELGQAFHDNGPRRFVDRFVPWLRAQAAQGRLAVTDPLPATEQFLALLRAGVFLRASLALPPPPTEAEIDATVRGAVDAWLRAYGVPATIAGGGITEGVKNFLKSTR